MGEQKPANGGAAASARATDGSGVAPDKDKVIADLKARLDAESLAKSKAEKDRDSYRAGMLAKQEVDKKLKKGEVIDLSDAQKATEFIEAKLEAKKLEDQAIADIQRQTSELDAANKRAEEAEERARAMEAKLSASGFSAGGSAGVNEHSESKPTGYWSDEQKAELRSIYSSRGMYNPDQIEKMVARAEQIARNRMATGTLNNDLVPTRKN